MEDKSWAQGLSQQEFEREYVTRHPFSDVIPDVNYYASHSPKYNGIDSFNPDTMEVEDPKPVIEEGAEPEAPKYFCRGCKKEFTYRVAQAGHEKNCKVMLNTRL